LNKTSRFNYKKCNFVGLSNYLDQINWNKEFDNLNINECYNKFLEFYKMACEINIPLVKIKSHKNKSKWMNNSILTLIKEKKRLWNLSKYTGFKNVEIIKNYTSVRQKVKKEVKFTVKNYEKNLAKEAKTNPKKIYSYINSKSKIKGLIRALNSENGESIIIPSEIVEILNNAFGSVFVKEDVSQMPFFNSRTNEICSDPIITKENIRERLRTLNKTKTPGMDNINPLILSECSSAFSIPLELIFNLSFSSGKCPDMWLNANITPLFKKGDKLDPLNYRPVSLTSVICKLMESIVRDCISIFLAKNKLINDAQHGFVCGKNCCTNLLETMDLITQAMEKKYLADVCFLDFAKAFDTVPHSRLAVKMNGYGIKGKLLEWCKAFLRNRVQRVVIGENASKWLNVSSGVPQGSVLGPLMFVIYINDLVDGLKNNCKLYADDTKIISIIKGPEDQINLQNDLNKSMEWTQNWLIKFNKEKCKVMHIGKQNPKYCYKIGETELKETEMERDLGILISNDLKWKNQVNSAILKANRILGQLKHSFVHFDTELIKLLYTSMIRPHLEYINSVWNPYLKEDINSLEKVQKRATKIGCLKNMNYENRLKKLGLTTLAERRERGDLIQFFKINNDIDKVKWHHPPQILNTNTRGHNLKFERQLTKTSEARFRFFTNRVIHKWNELPRYVVESNSINEFKNGLDRYYR
jgi:hypothetical protein